MIGLKPKHATLLVGGIVIASPSAMNALRPPDRLNFDLPRTAVEVTLIPGQLLIQSTEDVCSTIFRTRATKRSDRE